MRVYIQSVDKFPISDDCLLAMMGFKQRGWNVILFEDIEEVPVQKSLVLVAFIKETKEFLKKLDIEVPSINIPDCLNKPKYLKRKVWTSTIEEVLEKEEFPLFLKPLEKNPDLPSGVVQSKYNAPLLLSKVPVDTKLIVSNSLDIVAEYRCYVMDNNIVGVKHYQGNFNIFPNMQLVDEMILSYAYIGGSPCCYTIDVGVLSNGETILIECNDAWAIGNYGLSSEIYSKFLSKRWFEIVGLTR